MLDILNNVQLTTKDSEHPLVVIVVTQWEIMQTALKSVDGYHGLLDDPVKLYKENTEIEPDVIDDGVLNQTAGTKRESMKTMLEITKSYREIYSKPVSENSVKSVRVKMQESKFVLISGELRDMNTALALHLANDYDDRGFVIVRNKSDISNIDMQTISLLMVEDIAGKYKYDEARLADWLEAFDSLLALVQKGKLNLVATIESDKMGKGINSIGQHPIFKHEVRIDPNDTISVKQEIDNPFASRPTQQPTGQSNAMPSGAGNSIGNSPVIDLNHADEPIDLSIRSVPVVPLNHTAIANQAQASSHHGIPSLEFVKNLNMGTLGAERIAILSERFVIFSTYDMIYSYNRQQGKTTGKVDIKGTVQQLTTVDANKVVGSLPHSGNVVVVINVSNTGALTILKTIYAGISCCGIAHSNGKLIISDDSGLEVSIMNMNGKVERTFSVGQDILLNPYQILYSKLTLSPNHDTIYISDPDNDTVTALTHQGSVLGVVKNKNQFRSPSGIAVDSVGRVYAWCMHSNNAFLVSPENSTVTTLSVVGGNVMRPLDATFCKWTNSIYVVDTSRYISVFKINDL